MTVGILTASRTDNNGTDLQALAMQKIFEKVNGQAIIINYKCDKLENSRKIFYPLSFRGFLNIPYQLCSHIQHENFRKKYFKYSQHIYNSDDIRYAKFDYLVVGSDQVWNLKITGNDINFFLPFETESCKISYAVSLGVLDISDWNREYNLKSMLNDFKRVSVRELSGVEVLKKIGIEAVCNLDPLLMIKSTEWNQIITRHKNRKPYILVYTVDRTYEILREAKELATEMKCTVIFYGNLLRHISGVRVKRFSGIEEWLDLVRNADLVVTNSYHGLSFAINFHKKFSVYWLTNSPQSNTRIKSLLSQIDVQDYEEGMICNPKWEKVEQNLDKMRNKSFQYIKEMLSIND